MEGCGRKKKSDMRIIFLLFAILEHLVLFAQDVENNKISVCGFFFEVYDKEEITDHYVNQYKQFTGEKSYSIAIDLRGHSHLIISETDGILLLEEILNDALWDGSLEISSDTVCIYPELRDTSLYRKCGFELLNVGKVNFIKKCALNSSPWYSPCNNKKLFKCFYFKGTAFIKSTNEMNQEWKNYLLDSYAIGNLKSKKSVLVVDDIKTYTPYILSEYLPIWLPLDQGTKKFLIHTKNE